MIIRVKASGGGWSSNRITTTQKEPCAPVTCKRWRTMVSPLFEKSFMKKRQINIVQFRDFTCAGYRRCLRTAALLNHPMADCRKCPNRRHKIPVPSPIYNEMIMEDAVNCTHLLTAIFHPERWQNQGTVKAPDPPQDVSLARVEWL